MTRGAPKNPSLNRPREPWAIRRCLPEGTPESPLKELCAHLAANAPSPVRTVKKVLLGIPFSRNFAPTPRRPP